MIRECHGVFGEEEHAPQLISPRRADLRQWMLEEEVGELRDAVAAIDPDLVQIADALADIVYVAYGTAFAYGIPLDEVVAEVHRSNMTKDFTGAAGEDKKLTKGPGYAPPNIAPILDGASRRYPAAS
jgi:predicted HAD superfamily Cof-like phosphohydrolase